MERQAVNTLGHVARLTVKDPKTLDNPVIHRVPSLMTVERLRMEMEYDLHKRGK